MVERLQVQGASGQAYIYLQLPDGVTPPFQAANLIVAERRRSRWLPLHVAETEYLPHGQWRPLLERIRRRAPGAKLFYRLNISHAARQTEVEDIERSRRRAGEDAPPAGWGGEEGED